MDRLKEIIAGIQPTDANAREEAWKNWDSLCKPLRGLGWLEEVVVQIAGIYGDAHPHPDKRAVVIMGADNGVVKEGVTQTDSSVTMQVLHKGQDTAVTLAAAGDSWRESGGMLEVIPEKQNAVELEITPFDSKKKRTVTLMLENFPKRPEKTTRVRVEISFLDEKTMRIVLTDLGFGELFPATGAKVVQEVML